MFRIGDQVVAITGTVDCVEVGNNVATVISISASGENIGLEFNYDDHNFHPCNGHAVSGRGYYARVDEIKLVKRAPREKMQSIADTTHQAINLFSHLVHGSNLVTIGGSGNFKSRRMPRPSSARHTYQRNLESGNEVRKIYHDSVALAMLYLKPDNCIVFLQLPRGNDKYDRLHQNIIENAIKKVVPYIKVKYENNETPTNILDGGVANLGIDILAPRFDILDTLNLPEDVPF